MKKLLYLVKSIVLALCVLFINWSCPEGTASAKESDVVNFEAELPAHIIEKGSTTSIKIIAIINGKKTKDIVYEVDNKKIASVDKNGKITAKSAGECRIMVYPKGYRDNSNYLGIKVVNKVIKISGPDKYEAGNTYQLKASEKNVIWDMHNVEGKANASVNPKTGKIKIRNAGEIYISCTSKDGKNFGAVYINAIGPIIEDKDYNLDPIVITEDEHIVSPLELVAAGKLPSKMTVPYTNKKVDGKVEVSIDWDYIELEEGEYTLYGYFKAPEGYLVPGRGYMIAYNVKATVDIRVPQTDTRKKVVSIEAFKSITISKNEHMVDYWDIYQKYFQNHKLKCTLEDGSVVEIPLGGISYDKDISGTGTYMCELHPKESIGYDVGDEDRAVAKLEIKITKKQTWAETVDSIDTIAEASYVYEFVSQKPLS